MGKLTEGLRTRFAKAAALEDAAEDVLAYRHLPLEHQRQLHSTNPLERLNKEIKRRSNVVGIFPNPAAVIRLVGAILDSCSIIDNVTFTSVPASGAAPSVAAVCLLTGL